MLKRIEALETTVVRLESSLDVSTQVNTVLTGEVERCHEEIDRLEQYSRRTCLVIEGINPVKNESPEDLFHKIKNLTTNHLLNNNNVNPQHFDFEFDKCHRIGPVRQNKQSVIVKFRSDSFREHIYRKKKSLPQGVKFKVSLTKKRIDILEKANEKTKTNGSIKFAYADVNGNLKLLLTEKSSQGRWALPFNNLKELDTLIDDHSTQSDCLPDLTTDTDDLPNLDA